MAEDLQAIFQAHFRERIPESDCIVFRLDYLCTFGIENLIGPGNGSVLLNM